MSLSFVRIDFMVKTKNIKYAIYNKRIFIMI